MKQKKPVRKTDPTKELIRSIAQAIRLTKGINPVVLDLRKMATYAEYLVIASATNSRQVQAMASRVEEAVRAELDKRPIGVEGLKPAHWVLLDYGDVVVHLFLEETRSFYRLENLWYDAKRVRI